MATSSTRLPRIVGNDKARFLSKVDSSNVDGCWLWLPTGRTRGYGKFNLAGRMIAAHRGAFILFVGDIPPGLTIDHLCHGRDESCAGGSGCLHRRCVNPTHLEAVPGPVNTARGRTIAALNAAKTHCDHGHEFTPENTYPIPAKSGGGRACRKCRDSAAAAYRARRRKAA